jgi:vacuolar-type H+-ATPase subunit F/Vma7
VVGVIVVLGEASRVAGFELAGAVVITAEDSDAVHRAWSALPEDTAVVVLTARAAEAIGEPVALGILATVMPA